MLELAGRGLWLAQLGFCLFFFPVAAGAVAGYGVAHPHARIAALVLFAPLLLATVAELTTYRGLRRG